MPNTAQALAGAAVVLMILAGSAWAFPLAGAQLCRLDGSATSVGFKQAAALLLLAAFGTSAVAAFLAVAKWSAT